MFYRLDSKKLEPHGSCPMPTISQTSASYEPTANGLLFGIDHMREEPLLLILDEPTAALDAETEHALFERYASALRDAWEAGEAREGGEGESGRITILVSHRFSTVRMADLIVVLDGARLVEVGTHEQLMDGGGQYSELYGIQAAAYR